MAVDFVIAKLWPDTKFLALSFSHGGFSDSCTSSLLVLWPLNLNLLVALLYLNSGRTDQDPVLLAYRLPHITVQDSQNVGFSSPTVLYRPSGWE